jgi:hypothetical protein
MTFIATMHVKVARRLHSNSLRYWLLEYLRRQPKGRKYKALILRFMKDRMATLLLLDVSQHIHPIIFLLMVKCLQYYILLLLGIVSKNFSRWELAVLTLQTGLVLVYQFDWGSPESPPPVQCGSVGRPPMQVHWSEPAPLDTPSFASLLLHRFLEHPGSLSVWWKSVILPCSRFLPFIFLVLTFDEGHQSLPAVE